MPRPAPAEPAADGISPRAVPPFRRALLNWYRMSGRDLPWRRTRDHWPIWVSEVMLQQTTVAAVLPHYDRFLRRFPTLEQFAAAPLTEALAAWSGLGYYSRVRNLHAAARTVAVEHEGRIPRDAVAVRALPGVGDYTAAALLSILHGEPRAVVDGNVIRVVARLLAHPGQAKSGALKRVVQATVDRWLDPAAPGDFNQAMMELGATLCTPTAPDCDRCPVRRWCRGATMGDPTRWPEPPVKAKAREERWVVALVRRGNRYLFRRRAESESLMPGLWELPSWKVEAPPAGESRSAWLLDHLQREIGSGIRLGGEAGEARHSILDRRLRLSVHHATLGESSRPRHPWKWIEADRLDEVGTSSMVKKILATALAFACILGSGLIAPRPAHADPPPPTIGVAADSSRPEIVIPELRMKTVDGKLITLHDLLKEGPVLLDFWALWCKPCLKELPELETLQATWRDRGLRLLAINADSPADVARVAPFVRTRGFTFPVVSDLDGAIRRRMQVNALPTTILLDRTGRTVWINQGYRPGDTVRIEEELKKLIGVPADSLGGD